MKPQKKESQKVSSIKAAETIDTKPQKPVVEKMEDIQRLVHLLQIHQVELEHQNEELRITQEELEVSRNKYVNLYDFSPTPYFTLNEDGLIKEVNLSTSQMFGIERRKLIGKNFNTLLLQEEKENFNYFIKTVFKTATKHKCELKLKNKTNLIYHVLLEGLEIVDLLEPEKKCQIALIDLSEYKRIEENLRKTTEELTLLNATKDKFFSIVAHDLRSPFHALLGLSEMLALDGEKFSYDEIKSFSSGLNANLKNLYGLLDNLLKWAMMQRNLVTFKPVKLNLLETINAVIEIAKQGIKNKGIIISNTIKKDVFVFADPAMLVSTIQNLITNAIKFTNTSGKITVYACEKQNFVEVSIHDTGIGINIDNFDELFNFESLYTTKGTDGEKGTGLGLALCKEFIEQNGGKIWVNSQVGKGTKISFTLRRQ
ncbi:MAG: PAS domain-containing sensor histidine kinase [bacterium]